MENLSSKTSPLKGWAALKASRGSKKETQQDEGSSPTKLGKSLKSKFGGAALKVKETQKAKKVENTRKASLILSQWTGIMGKKSQDKASPVQLNATLRRWQKRAMYGQPERFEDLENGQRFKSWYIDQRDGCRVELPEALLVDIAEEASYILTEMRERYKTVLGENHPLVHKTEVRLKETTSKMDTELIVETEEPAS